MRYGLHLGAGAPVNSPQALHEVAALAEELGYDSILAGDHIVTPKRITSQWPRPYVDYYEGAELPFTAYTDLDIFDPFELLTFVAAVTRRVRLGLSILVLPYRHPYDVARRVATLDVLSGGRVILGVGVGWLKQEFELLGIPFQERAQRTREYLTVMKALWTQDQPRFSGRFITLSEDVNVLPRPVQKPHPPIWIGGESLPALRRVVEFGDGWHIMLVPLEQIRAFLEKLKPMMEQAGRDFSQLQLTALVDPNKLTAKDARDYRDLGISILYTLPAGIGGDRAGFHAVIRNFARMVGDAG